jgi:hypothetical protein
VHISPIFIRMYVPLDTRGYLPLSRSGTKMTPS